MYKNLLLVVLFASLSFFSFNLNAQGYLGFRGGNWYDRDYYSGYYGGNPYYYYDGGYPNNYFYNAYGYPAYYYPPYPSYDSIFGVGGGGSGLYFNWY